MENENVNAEHPITTWSRNYYSLFPVFFLLIIVIIRISYEIYKSTRQKTRNPQQRRMYGSRQRPSLTQQEPTIYVSPANLPPPPKYEAMAPPSYDEVVGVHSPYYQPAPLRPITQPIATAMAQSSNQTSDSTVITVSTNEEPRRPSVRPAAVVVTNA